MQSASCRCPFLLPAHRQGGRGKLPGDRILVIWRAVELGRVGIWASALRRGARDGAIDAAREIESLGFRAAWIPGGEEGMGERFVDLLACTHALVFGVGVVNIWKHSAAEAAAAFNAATHEAPGRLFLGVGIGHRPLLEADSPAQRAGPLDSVRAYLDGLDAAIRAIPRSERFLGALGPRMLRLAAERTAGAHPYLVTPQHTRDARLAMGRDALLAPEQHVVLDSDPVRARALARQWMAVYLGLPNYIANFHRMGFADEDLARGGSDRIVDALVAWGDAHDIVHRLQQHLEAGANHVALQVLCPDRMTFPKATWRTLARVLKSEGQL